MKDLQKIIDDAPEGATHYTECDNEYISIDTEYRNDDGFWCVRAWNSKGGVWSNAFYDLHACEDIRSLADIKQILELQEQNEWINLSDKTPKYGDRVWLKKASHVFSESYVFNPLTEEIDGFEGLVSESECPLSMFDQWKLVK